MKADICDSEEIMKIFEENDIDRVVHFAAESHVDRSIRNPEVFVKTNVLGTLVMLNAAKAAWELPDGTFKPDKNSFMCLRMRSMVLWKKTVDIFMRQPLCASQPVLCQQGIFRYAGKILHGYL